MDHRGDRATFGQGSINRPPEEKSSPEKACVLDFVPQIGPHAQFEWCRNMPSR